jgi:glycosyltransferase involved in cell wall biosynthesis
METLSIGIVLALLWTSRFIAYALGLPRVPDITTLGFQFHTGDFPRLSIIVPARNEAAAIEACITSLLALDYPDFEVIAVNDRSSDATGAIMDRLAVSHPACAQLKVIHISDLPDGWMGKTHAMWCASEVARGELILFTDGDTIFRPDSLRRAVSFLLNTASDHIVIYPTMLFKSAGERMMISFFQTMLSFVHRPWKMSDPKSFDHIGVGAFNLIRKSAYGAIGTYAAMRMEVIDDLRLGRLVKQHGFRQDVALGPDLVSLHWVSGAMGIVRNLSKNAFAALRFQWIFVFAVCLGIGFITLGPVFGLLVAKGTARLGYAVALVAMAGIYIQTRRITRISAFFFFTHPLAAVLTVYMVLRSAWLTTLHGVTWRGTSYPLRQFRKAAGKN